MCMFLRALSCAFIARADNIPISWLLGQTAHLNYLVCFIDMFAFQGRRCVEFYCFLRYHSVCINSILSLGFVQPRNATLLQILLYFSSTDAYAVTPTLEPHVCLMWSFWRCSSAKHINGHWKQSGTWLAAHVRVLGVELHLNRTFAFLVCYFKPALPCKIHPWPFSTL